MTSDEIIAEIKRHREEWERKALAYASEGEGWERAKDNCLHTRMAFDDLILTVTQ